MASKNNRFRGGLDGTTYTCALCKKRTRETGEGESGVELCAFCYEEAGAENSLNDGMKTPEEFAAEIRRIEKKYKRRSPAYHVE